MKRHKIASDVKDQIINRIKNDGVSVYTTHSVQLVLSAFMNALQNNL